MGGREKREPLVHNGKKRVLGRHLATLALKQPNNTTIGSYLEIRYLDLKTLGKGQGRDKK